MKTQDDTLREEYEQGWKITDVCLMTGQGFTSHRDDFAIAFDKNTAVHRIADMQDDAVSDDALKSRYQLKDTGTWKLAEARAQIKRATHLVQKCLYRPFDLRYCLLHPSIMDRPRIQSQSHMMQQNFALSTTRSVEIGAGFEHIFCTDTVMDRHAVSLKEINYLFPLWIYPTVQEEAMGMERQANLNPAFLTALHKRIGMTPTPEAIFHYAYAVFHAPTYRTRYSAFLKIDFPRLPLPPDAETFRTLAALGAKLVALHLLENPALNNSGVGFPVGGDHHVKKMRAQDRYIAPLTPQVWGEPFSLEASGKDGTTKEKFANASKEDGSPQTWGGYGSIGSVGGARQTQ